MRRKRVYIAGPISKGDLGENVNRATDAFWELLGLGFAPLCPHWSVYAGGCFASVGRLVAEAEALPRGSCHADWIGADLPWVEVADALLRLPGESAGADAEVAHAKRSGVPVFNSVNGLIVWAQCHKPPYYQLPIEVN
jgi:hypothetical protein